MSFARSADQEGLTEAARARKRTDGLSAEPAAAAPFTGPSSLSPAAVLQRQTVLGNAHVGRVFRSPVTPVGGVGPEEKQECNCPDKENCSCPK